MSVNFREMLAYFVQSEMGSPQIQKNSKVVYWNTKRPVSVRWRWQSL